MLRTLLIGCLLVASAPLRAQASLETLELGVELLNKAMESSSSFTYKFQDDQLISDSCTITVYPPVKILVNETTFDSMFDQNQVGSLVFDLPGGFTMKHNTYSSDIFLDMNFCQVTTNFIVNSSISKTLSLDVNCEQIRFINGTTVPNGSEYVPLLQEALQTTAIQYFIDNRDEQKSLKSALDVFNEVLGNVVHKRS